jgi:catechol 2,3-dioxygenase-like lactoylglutathione lyase family enzyme
MGKPGQPQGIKVFHCSPVVADFDKMLAFYRDALSFRIDRDCGITEPGTMSLDGPGNIPLGVLLGLPGAQAKAMILNVGPVPKRAIDAGLLLDMVEFVEPWATISRPPDPVRKAGIGRVVFIVENLENAAERLKGVPGARPAAAAISDQDGRKIMCWYDADGILVQLEEERSESLGRAKL